MTPDFPDKHQIEEAMQGYEADHFVPIYGDGNLTTPRTLWAAVGGFGIWIPRWVLPGEELEQRKEEDSSGPTIGQTGSSTKHELMAWIVLTKPIRAGYATDIAAMLCKAEQLLSKARARQETIQAGRRVKKGCPFKKPWGLQTDGDLWEIAWETIWKRGGENQKLRKVKGHATKEDVQEGRNTAKDRVGNDRIDRKADNGVLEIAGEGLVTLGSWAAERHKNYTKFLRRIHRMIAAATKAKKEERAKGKQVEEMVLGCDPEKWTGTNLRICKGNQGGRDFHPLDQPPPITGRHRYAFCQQFYLDVHDFLNCKRWAPTNPEEDVGGITWAELFIMFDTSGKRSPKGEHVADQHMTKRAEARNASNGKWKEQARNGTSANAIAKPLYGDELGKFKAVVKQIAKHELDEERAAMFLMEDIRRL